MSGLWGAVIIGAIIALAALPLVSHALQPHGRHTLRRAIAEESAAAEARAWIRELRPDRSLAGLRLRRDLRRWMPSRRLP